MTNGSQEVSVIRTTLPSPTIDNPSRQVIMIQYQVGMLPPHFVYCDKDQYTEKKEKELIAADIKKRLETPSTIIKL